MVDFNLLPSDLASIQKKKAGLKIKIPKIFPTPVIILVISVLLLTQGSIGILAVNQRNRLIKLNAAFSEISPQAKVAEALKKELDELERKLSVIDALTSGSLIWAKKLYYLSGAVIEGVWLTSLSLSADEPKGRGAKQPAGRQTLVLEGSAVSPTPGGETAIVGKFIESLRGNKGFFSDFEDIKVSTIQRRKLGEIEIMDFTIICYFKSGRRYFEKLKA